MQTVAMSCECECSSVVSPGATLTSITRSASSVNTTRWRGSCSTGMGAWALSEHEQSTASVMRHVRMIPPVPGLYLSDLPNTVGPLRSVCHYAQQDASRERHATSCGAVSPSVKPSKASSPLSYRDGRKPFYNGRVPPSPKRLAVLIVEDDP